MEKEKDIPNIEPRPKKAQKAGYKARLVISDAVVDYCESGLLQEDLTMLQPKERLELIVKMAQFVIPKLQAVQAEVASAASKTIEDKLIQLSQDNR